MTTPTHRFVDDGRLALAYLGATSGVPVCSWDEDGLGACDRYRGDWVHRCDNCGQPLEVCGGCVEDEDA